MVISVPIVRTSSRPRKPRSGGAGRAAFFPARSGDFNAMSGRVGGFSAARLFRAGKAAAAGRTCGSARAPRSRCRPGARGRRPRRDPLPRDAGDFMRSL